ncbi:MAG TPA: polysaccharide lyase family protein [Terriglobales bacterium]|nr:polysaccharide lyase family protein [Terriglobales bacterium]
MIDHRVRLGCISLGILFMVVLLGNPSLAGSQPAIPTNHEVFTIGVKDGSFREFDTANLPQGNVVFEVGNNSAKYWPAYQPGSLDNQVRASTMQEGWVSRSANEQTGRTHQSTITFKLTAARGTFTLHLGMIFRYRRAATPRLVLVINEQSAGTYLLNPRPAPELWWPNGGEGDGNLQYFGYESLDLPLRSGLFQAGRNTLTMSFEDGFGIYFDYLSLSNNSAQELDSVVTAEVTPSVLYKKSGGGLVELVDIRIRSQKKLGSRKLTLKADSLQVERQFQHSAPGDVFISVEVPDLDKPSAATLTLSGYSQPVWKGTFEPKRKWKVYALPMEQADFGYNDFPARTLEWENRFIDKTLEIQKAYPDYSYTLDASANLESYLATRPANKSSQVLDYLRSGKWGINALYANFFTGLCSAEELFRSLDFGLRAGQTHGFPVDSASQTDEPSVTWALPQILADAGIKYFTNGSDPIRGALNPIGLLNFKSPFYWESPTGSKILVWSGVSYTAVDDITWGGWNKESVQRRQYAPSLFGMTRSLPLFLSQYERADFPFDAVLLFGLHNDEIPMRYWGDADVLNLWNKEYEFPKMIAGTQRDFFTHITKNFSDSITTLRGDAGSYWEDEAGADARTAATIRAAQTQIVAAEKLESVSQWLNPDLTFEEQPFQSTWRNILLADSYVWSDANSFRRPYSYRTLGGEAAHRSWAESANQTSSDLRLIALDKIAELIDDRRPGAVVFNSESWTRSDLFDFELEMDEMLVDPTNSRPIPCGTIQQSFGYKQVRCWASDIPGVGYRFYPIAKGSVPNGEPLDLDPRSPMIENDFYRVKLDSTSGAIVDLIDKTTNADLVDPASAYKLNEHLYVTGGDPGNFRPGSLKDNRILAADITLPLPELQVHEPKLIRAPTAVRFPWGIVVTTLAKNTNTPAIKTTITLPSNEKKIIFDNSIEKEDTLQKEAVYFAFPFALEEPRMMYQGATAWVDPERDMLPGANRQWFATQGGVWAEGKNINVAFATREAPLVTLQDINRGLWPESIKIDRSTVFSYAMNNYWYTDTPSHQGGQFQFHYAISSGKDLVAADAFSLAAEERNPLTVLRHYNMGWTPSLPASGTGFMSASPRGVAIIGMTPMDEAGKYLIRVQNFTPEAVTAKVVLSRVHLKSAFAGSVLGNYLGTVEWHDNSFTVPLQRYQIKTIVLSTRELSKGPAN